MLKRLLGVVLLLLASSVSAQFVIPPYGLYITQADVTSEFFWGRYFVPATPTTNSVLAYWGADSKPRMATLGGTFTWDGTTINVGSISSSSVTGLATVATSGSYLDLTNRPTIPAAQVNADWNASSGVAQILNKPTIPSIPSRSFNNNPGRSLNSCFQISSTRDAQVSYGVDITTTLTLASASRGSAYLRTYTDSGCTTGQQTLDGGTNGMPTTLSVTVGSQLIGSVPLKVIVPAGSWVRIETAADAGTGGAAPSFSIRNPGQQEVLL